MPWLRISDRFYSHPAVMRASAGAIGLWVRCGAWSVQQTSEGLLPREVVLNFGTEAQARDLVRVGLWKSAQGGWEMLRFVPAVAGGREAELWDIERTDYRRKIPQYVRDLVFERDEYRCISCSATEDLTLDHIYPWSLGGPDTVENLRVLCRPCNSSKGART